METPTQEQILAEKIAELDRLIEAAQAALSKIQEPPTSISPAELEEIFCHITGNWIVQNAIACALWNHRETRNLFTDLFDQMLPELLKGQVESLLVESLNTHLASRADALRHQITSQAVTDLNKYIYLTYSEKCEAPLKAYLSSLVPNT